MNRQSRLSLRLILVSGVLLLALGYASVDTAWVRRYDGPAHGDDWATRIAVDSAGCVYVTATSSSDTSSSAQYLDFVTIKYYPNGDTAWVRRADFGGKDIPYGLAVDQQGNVYVAGTNNDNRMVTVKYSPTGQRLWYELFGSQGGAFDLALDSQGNPIVCGSSFRSTLDAALVKYRPNGDTAWARYYDWAGDEDHAMALALGSMDGVATTGYGAGTSTHYDCISVMYDSVGGRLWAAGYDGPSHGDDRTYHVAVDGSGSVIVVGYGDNGYTTPYDYLVIKYDSTGETLWTRRYDGPAHGEDRVRAAALDCNGNVYVTGRSQGEGSNYYDCATVKYTNDGTFQWASLYDGPVHSADGAYDLTVDASGYAYVTGSVAIGQSVGGCITIKYDSDGDTVWVATYVAPPDMPNYGTAIAVGADGSVYVAGNHGNDILTIKYVQDGGVVETLTTPVAARLSLLAEPSVFRRSTAVRFCAGRAAALRVMVFDAGGRRVRVLANGLKEGSVTWDGANESGSRLPPGVYMLVLEAGEERVQVKVVMAE
jgi:uncharacterized delta-60 repeat protein